MTYTQPTNIEQFGHERISEDREIFHYPFLSETAKEVEAARAKGIEVDDWHAPGKEISEILRRVDGPVLELAGPTDTGFYFLEGQELLSRPIISNIAPDTLKFLPDSTREQANQMTDMIIDGRHMDGVPDNSLGIVLAANLNLVDETNLSHEEVMDRINKVDELIRHDAENSELSSELLAVAQKLQVAQEVFRKLQPGGLYITDGTQDELRMLSHLGFEPVAVHGRDLSGDDSTYFDVVLQKPDADHIVKVTMV